MGLKRHEGEQGLFWTLSLEQPKGAGGKKPSGGASGSGPRIKPSGGPCPESTWSPETNPWPELRGDIVIDVETHDPGIQEGRGPGWAFRDYGKLVGIGVAHEGGKYYYPFAHEGGGNLPQDQVLRYFEDQLKNPSLTVGFHNAPYDLGWLRRYGIFVHGQIHDTQTMAALLDEHRKSYSLDSVAQDYLGRGKDESLLKAAAAHFGLDPKGGLWRLHSKFVGPYGEGDCGTTLDLMKLLRVEIEAQGLDKVYQLERDIIPILVEMRWRGIRIDLDRAERVKGELLEKERAISQRIRSLTGVSVEIWAAESIAKAFDNAGLTYPRTEKKEAPSFTADWLSAHPHELPKLIVKARQLNKLRTTFVEGHILGHEVNGRIHPQFHPLRSDEGGTVSARFSSSNPNFQQLPSEPEDLPYVRALCLPEEGEQWAALDYSQQEPRITVHGAAAAGCTGADKMVRAYHDNPKTDLHGYVAQLMHLDRTPAKVMNLSIIYGRGGASVCRELGLPTRFTDTGREIAGEEGQALIDQYAAELPFMRELSDKVKARLAKVGHVVTLAGRRCRFPEGMSHHKGLNRWVQSSAADMIKVAMVNLYREGIVPLVTVHDENGISSPSPTHALKAARIMEEAIPLRVPVLVDVEMGPCWGEVVKIN